MKYIIILSLLGLVACQEFDFQEDHDKEPTSEEIQQLEQKGIDHLGVVVHDNYLIAENDMALNRDKLIKERNKVNSRNRAVSTSDTPLTESAIKILVYRHPSFYTLDIEFQYALNQALHYINGLPHSAVTLLYSNSPSSDVIILSDDTTDPDIPLAFKNLGSANLAVADLALNEEFGDFLSINKDYTPSYYENKNLSITKLLIHELYHTLGMGHSCVLNHQYGSPLANNVIETTLNLNWKDYPALVGYRCDSTSVMFGTLTPYPLTMGGNNGSPTNIGIGGTDAGLWEDSILESDCQGHSIVMNLWMNPNDTFALQALYPCSYEPFEAEIEDCEYLFLPDAATLGQNNEVVRFHINYPTNNFVPYRIEFSLYDGNKKIGKVIRYRYWEDYVDFPYTQLLEDHQGACVHLEIEVSNWKRDVTNSVSTNCCVWI